MKIQGQLEHSDLEGGSWVFRAQDGSTYQLEGLPSQFLKNGARLEIEGEVDQGGFSLSMMGAVFQVKQARSL